ncbi:MAG: CoA activase [Verrucomicrobia bacterium]|nr:CoA activase [Verrucomicrobiota bacterium]
MQTQQHPGGRERFLGIDAGAETIKVVEVRREKAKLRWTRREIVEHGKAPGLALQRLLREWEWDAVQAAAVSGRFGKQVQLPRVPAKQAQARAFRFLCGEAAATIVSIGGHGFSVLELRDNGLEVFRENSRCSQGTGNFLRQLVERFSLTIEEASELAASVEKPAPLSGRCPVILKSDMTHLANKGEDRGRILAGLFDAVCENVQGLIKPDLSPARVVLIGGVGRSPRVQAAFREFLGRHRMTLLPLENDDGLFFEALGCALVAAETTAVLPTLDSLLAPPNGTKLDRVPALAASLHKVRRMVSPPPALINGETRELVLGFDIGSTGSKCVALDAGSRAIVWQGYRQTLGDPVGAAQELATQFLRSPAGRCPVLALGVTGSGREIVGSLMTTCYGKDAVFVLNEIAAHAEGALHYDPRVDTIFEIGGQDAKYIRLAAGRVMDSAMNEACSAGTGSFIEEQGRKFAGIRGVAQLGQEALAAGEGVSLGQHCSVFMAEIIDEAIAAGVDHRSVIAGLYDSVIQNYLNRVKGSRSVGQVIFCQGMPFASDALAAAVVRQTGCEVVVPPDPGTVGALGIALLTLRSRREAVVPPAGVGSRAGDSFAGVRQAPRLSVLALDRFLSAKVESKDHFTCHSAVGCGGQGSRCRIDRLHTVVENRRQKFTWGGGCALHDKATRKKKLPDLAPDPFREREALIKDLVAGLTGNPAGDEPLQVAGCGLQVSPARALPNLQPSTFNLSPRPTVALSDEFMLKGLFPFFATFLRALGLDLLIVGGSDHAMLKRGIREANVPFCAPLQQFHGLASRMAETGADYLFVPMVRSLPRVNGEPHAVTCPLVQASPDMLGWDLRRKIPGQLLSPLIDAGEGNLRSPEFLESCRRLAEQLGLPEDNWQRAHALALEAQTKFEAARLDIGRRALAFAREHGLTAVVVLGRPYTIYNTVLNSNVPAILREQGALAIPVDCYPVAEEVPTFRDMYWSYGQHILRAAHQVRRTPGCYAVYCSNYSCGPDSFNLHFFAHIMEGKPFALIETDGHSGDAGTKTRLEAFLHCVAQDLAAGRREEPNEFAALQQRTTPMGEIRRRGETLLVPWISEGAQFVAACFRGAGLKAECLPQPDAESLRLGRRHTSGKECLPMCLTLGNLLKRLAREPHSDARFAVLMPSTHGPCREGTYNLLNQIVLQRLGWADRVRIWTLQDAGYFDDMPAGFSTLLFTAVMAADLLLDALHDVRPVETRAGAANAIYRRHFECVLQHLERAASGDLSLANSLWQVASGRLFGVRKILDEAAAEFAAVRGAKRVPTVLVVGEIYVRCDAFANNFIIEELERRGLRAKLAPFNEWLEYSDAITRRAESKVSLGDRLTSLVQRRIQHLTHARLARHLNWPERATVTAGLDAVGPYLRPDLRGEAALTLGVPIHEWRAGHIDAVVSVGPLECMPNKIAEAQFFHVAEQERLLSLTLSLNGDPVEAEVLDNFAFEVHARFERPRPTVPGRRSSEAVSPVHFERSSSGHCSSLPKGC